MATWEPTGLGGNSVLLGQSGAAVSHTGDATEAILATIAVPANVLGANGRLEVRAMYTRPAGDAGNATARIRFGLSGSGLTGTLMASSGITNAQLSSLAIFNINNANSTSSQIAMGGLFEFLTTTPAATAAIDTTKACEINLDGLHATTTDTITLAGYQVLAFPHA